MLLLLVRIFIKLARNYLPSSLNLLPKLSPKYLLNLHSPDFQRKYFYFVSPCLLFLSQQPYLTYWLIDLAKKS